MGGDCLLTSEDLGALRRVKDLARHMRIGWIVDADPGDPRSLEINALSLHLPLATPGLDPRLPGGWGRDPRLDRE